MEFTQAKVLSCGTDRAEEAGKAENASEYPQIRKRVPEVCACILQVCTTQGLGFVLATAPRWRGGAAFMLIWWEPSYTLGPYTATKPCGIARGPGRHDSEAWTLRSPSF